MNLTDDERADLLATKNEEQWNSVCDKIKAARDGQYPPDWWPVVMRSGMMALIRGRWAP